MAALSEAAAGLARSGGPFIGGAVPGPEDARLFAELLGSGHTALHRWVRQMVAIGGRPPDPRSGTAALFDLVDASGRIQDDEATREWRDRWLAEQLRLREQLIVDDAMPWSLPLSGDAGATAVSGRPPLRRVGGVDISFVKDSDTAACASLVVLDWELTRTAPDRAVLYENTEMISLTLPYICGFLAFREVPHLERLVERLRADRPDLVPDLILVDGSGVLHPVGFGAASHLGVVTGIPTVGVAKNFLAVDGMELKEVIARCRQPGALPAAGSVLPLIGDSGRQWGVALRATEQSTNPIFVSAGHLVSQATAAAVCRHCCRSRVPEPVRQADLRSRAFLRDRGLL
eukprot:TRINITY_DN17540_c0_g1_i1.p1 TRINITY_DN17540_c0_g1~~TRINITY_DN17540_c0_g1_i1.p1  ORF type:complete len:390 (+),score=68.71 TRINITY_DN17540_c0_g1_i1:136-1170(+)